MSQPIKLTLRQINETEAIVILDSIQGQADHQFMLPWLDNQEWNAVFLYMELFKSYPETWPNDPEIIALANKLKLAREDGTPTRQRFKQIGQTLYKTIFGNDRIERLFLRAFHSYQGGSPLIQLHFPDAGSYLQTYPWELLHDEDDFLFDSLRASLVRYIDFGRPIQPIQLSDKLNLLLVDPRPPMPDQYARLPNLDRTTLTRLFAQTSSRLYLYTLDTTSTPDTSFAQFTLTLNKFYQTIQIVHFDGHGDYGRLCDECGQLSPQNRERCQQCGCAFSADQKAQGYIAFTAVGGDLQWVGGVQLAKALLNRNIQLVVLLACNSGLTGGGSAFNSVAGMLVKQGIPAVVAMQFPVEVTSTQAFVTSFYQTLLNDAPLAQGMAAAKTSLLTIEDAWYRPVLYLRADPMNAEGKIFERENPITQTPIVSTLSLPSPQQPSSSKQTVSQPNLALLRRQLNQLFDDAELDSFCLDNLPQVYDRFSRGMRKDEKITLLLDFCRRFPTYSQKLNNELQKFFDRQENTSSANSSASVSTGENPSYRDQLSEELANTTYNLRNVHLLLVKGFSEEDLLELRFDLPVFEPIYDYLTKNASKAEIATNLISYAERHLIMDLLLNWAENKNPTIFGIYHPYRWKAD